MTNASGGNSGGAGPGASSGQGPGVAPGAQASDGAKAGRVEVIDAGGQSLGQFGQDGKPVAPNVAFQQANAERERTAADRLAESIRSSRTEPAHRYEVQDPFAETTYRLPTAAAAVAKAEELGSSRFQHRDADDSVKQVDKVAGQWVVRQEPTPPQDSQKAPTAGDKPLSEVQATIDRDALRAIEARAQDRASAGKVDPQTDQLMATADAHAFRRIEAKSTQQFAAAEMAENARTSPEYKEGLDKAIPGYPGTAQKVYALAAEMQQRSDDKDARKNAEFESMQLEKAERARAWTPEQAADQARKDASALREAGPTERYYAAGDMATSADHSKAYRDALAKDAPGVAAEVEARRVRPDAAAANDGMAPRGLAANEPGQREALLIDPATQSRLADARSRDRNNAAAEMGLNGIEPSTTREAQAMDAAGEAQRAAWLRKGQEAQQSAQQEAKGAPAKPGGNQVESDEVFTASRADVKPVVPADVEKRYLRVGDKFYHPQNSDVVAFEDKGNRLETRSNSEAVAETMVHIAKARGWDEIKVSGSETFRREVWMEAAASGMQVKGYTPTEQDKVELAKRGREQPANTVEDDKRFRARESEASAEPSKAAQQTPDQRRAQAFSDRPPAEAVKDHPELAGAYAASAATSRKAEADGLTPEQRAIVSARVRQNIVNAIERGEAPQVNAREERQIERSREKEATKEATR